MLICEASLQKNDHIDSAVVNKCLKEVIIKLSDNNKRMRDKALSLLL